jgi:hypothetical protein
VWRLNIDHEIVGLLPLVLSQLQVQEKFRNGSLDTLSTAVIRNFLLANGQKTSGTKEKIVQRVHQALGGQGQALMEADGPKEPPADRPVETNGPSSSQAPPGEQPGTYPLPAAPVPQFVAQQL